MVMRMQINYGNFDKFKMLSTENEKPTTTHTHSLIYWALI